MTEWIDRRVAIWASVAAVGGIVLLLGAKLIDEPDATAVDLLLELLDNVPMVLTSVGLAILFQITRRQHEDQMTLIHDLEAARVHGQRWRSEARTFLNGLGAAMDMQFSRWSLTRAERERTVRSQARTLYSKAGLSGRAALSAFFLEDLLAPADGIDPAILADERDEEHPNTRSIQ